MIWLWSAPGSGLMDDERRKDLVILAAPWAKHSAKFRANAAAKAGEIRTHDGGLLLVYDGGWEVIRPGDSNAELADNPSARRPCRLTGRGTSHCSQAVWFVWFVWNRYDPLRVHTHAERRSLHKVDDGARTIWPLVASRDGSSVGCENSGNSCGTAIADGRRTGLRRRVGKIVFTRRAARTDSSRDQALISDPSEAKLFGNTGSRPPPAAAASASSPLDCNKAGRSLPCRSRS